MLRMVFNRCSGLPVTCLVALLVPFSAAAHTFTMRGIPAVVGQLCDDLAFEEGKRFSEFVDAQGSVVDAVSAKCVEDAVGGRPGQWNIQIAYSAEQPLTAVSTINPSPVLNPGFRTNAECVAALSGEKQVFEAQTGLTAFTKYCQAPVFSGQNWLINLTGFGAAVKRPFSTWSMISGLPVGYSYESFRTMVQARLAQMDAVLAQLTVSMGAVDRTIGVRYYGPTDVKFTVAERVLAKYNRSEPCLADVSEASAGLDALGIANIGTYCAKLDFDGRFELITLNDVQVEIPLARNLFSFSTFEACAAEKPGILAHYRENLGRDVKAAFCSYDIVSRVYRLHLLEK